MKPQFINGVRGIDKWERIKDINHKVNCFITEFVKKHCSTIVLEDLGKISKKEKPRDVSRNLNGLSINWKLLLGTK